MNEHITENKIPYDIFLQIQNRREERRKALR
jgi:hypothetical protein